MRSLVYACLASLFVSLVAFGQTTTTTTPTPAGTSSFSADLSPINLVPPLEDRTESATASIDINMVAATGSTSASAIVSFDINLDNATSDMFTGFAIGEGAAGLNGPEVVQTVLNADPDAPVTDTLSGQMTITSQTQIQKLQELMQNPEKFYVLLTATENPDGLLRGQLKAGDDMGNEVDSLSDKIDRMQEQLNVIQQMLRSVGGVLGIDPKFLPEPGTGQAPGGTTTTQQ